MDLLPLNVNFLWEGVSGAKRTRMQASHFVLFEFFPKTFKKSKGILNVVEYWCVVIIHLRVPKTFLKLPQCLRDGKEIHRDGCMRNDRITFSLLLSLSCVCVCTHVYLHMWVCVCVDTREQAQMLSSVSSAHFLWERVSYWSGDQ